MTLDFPTIALMSVAVAGLVGVLMLFSWAENRAVTAWAWWGAAYILIATGFTLVTLRPVLGPFVSIVLANALVLGGYGMVWMGARAFEGRTTRVAAILAAPAIWIVAMQIAPFAENVNARVVLASSFMSLYCALAAHELWRGRAEPLRARSLLLVLFAVYVLLLQARIAMTVVAPIPDALPLEISGWFIQSAISGLICALLLGFLMLILPRQRAELHYRTAALVDPLTALANRRAFLERAEPLLRNRFLPQRPAALLLFDLDRFKEINDCHGHAAGDRTLQLFADIVMRHLRPDDLAGRLGGEEFAVLLPDADLNTAVAIAESIRDHFGQEAAEVDGQALQATVSVGIACSDDYPSGIDDLLARADIALYRAKHAGRDRVEVIGLPPGMTESPAPAGLRLVGAMG
ncbi:MAG: GGDEF domain-containing protein [Alphaproteobacteria bacterium]|nr:MAG: GGDEF domain-containing protein [Alphaproteobacteria bacterium]